jgi:hypothetical protein
LSGNDYSPSVRAALTLLERTSQQLEIRDQEFLSKLCAARIALEALEMTELRSMSALSLGQPAGTMASFLKLAGSELVQK